MLITNCCSTEVSTTKLLSMIRVYQNKYVTLYILSRFIISEVMMIRTFQRDN
ncbi:unknown [Spodoptera litura nucleopolyhedrovirus]|uniref:Uncharacterized protein n=1 Tax=Spodoptera litura multicapsid nucleopolyhedrovirus TaxID=46242 RepID=Q91BK6_NPVST|nr:hypothetical protein [Spodoptera litura nucleopolyhedrovirus]AAL01824.1 unknown [Spodoptera litura nucleopolyhedrovirus]QHN73859.1 hypothetical protein [Spodoptera litura nucleopolyhedrovirus]